MKLPTRTLSLLALLSLATASGALVLQGDASWTPWKFQVGETYEFRMTDHSRADQPPVGLVLDLAPSSVKSRNGEEQAEVSYTTKVLVPVSELGQQTAFGGGASLGMGPALLMLNPMITAFAGQLSFEVGEKMSLFGAGRVEVAEKVEVAGIEGFLCKLYGAKQQGEPLTFEWVVNPDVAVPLKSITYDQQGKKTWEVELLRYEKR